MTEEPVDILVRLQNLQQFVSETELAGGAVRKIGAEAKVGAAEAESGARKLSGVVGLIGRAARGSVVAMTELARKTPGAFAAARRSITGLHSSLESTAKRRLLPGGGMLGGGLLGAGIGFLSVAGIKGAIDSTVQLAKNARALHMVTGMSTEDAATWSAVVQAYGINARSFAMSLRAIATQTFQAQAGSKQARAIFNALGISMMDVHRVGGNMNNMLNMIIDRFNKLPPGVDKTAIATRLFGRNWQGMAPLLAAGSKAITEQRKEAEAYGVALGGNATANAMKLHEAQVQLRLASIGLQVQFAEHLAPAMFKVFGFAMKIFAVLRQQLTPAFHTVGGVIHSVTGFLDRHKAILSILKVVLAAFVAAWIIGRIQIIAARIALLALNGIMVIGKAVMLAWKIILIAWRAAMIVGTAAVWLFNAALDANPIGLVIIAIAALIAIIILVATHFKQVEKIAVAAFHWIVNAAKDVWKWIKNHWPLLAGILLAPMTFGASIIIALFHKQILGAIKSVWSWIKGAWHELLQIITWPFREAWKIIQAILNAISHAIGKVLGPIKSVLHFAGGAVHTVTHGIGSAINAVGNFLGFAGGGTTPYTGTFVVGERGPELVQLPGGSRITPVGTAGIAGVGPLSGFEFKFEIPVYIGGRNAGRELTRATGKYVSDRRARQG